MCQRKLYCPADQMLEAVVVRVDRYGRIAEHGFGAGRRDYYLSTAVHERVANMPEVPLLFFVHDFDVCEGGTVKRTVVDQTLTSIDKSLVPHLFESPIRSLDDLVIESKSKSCPVTADTHLAHLSFK